MTNSVTLWPQHQYFEIDKPVHAYNYCNMNNRGIMIKIPSFLFVAVVVDVLESLARGRADAELDDEVGPEDVHAVEDKCHDEKVAVLEANDVPLVLRSGLVRVDIGEQAEGEDYDPEVDPDTGH